ncbi:hypothetical protein ACSJL2_003794 [Serratia sarumanii]|uniref:hypothetical protein n=1 Tax=Serratia TaxID=613 RepID=UPI00076088C0|nr:MULTISPECIES: hypothetical protein [Serratia]MCK1090237.1 hypothetical protein [Serratia marcescens]HBU6104892.1 hypothetical protein [Serratia marcescens]HEJ8018409.1 hypothetical protein [Serratia marcescens]
MLEQYFGPDLRSTPSQKQRLLAVQAALEIAKASAAAPTAKTHSDKVADDLKYAAAEIEKLADAIQSALNKLE